MKEATSSVLLSNLGRLGGTSELFHLRGKGAEIIIHQLLLAAGGELFLGCVNSQNSWPLLQGRSWHVSKL